MTLRKTDTKQITPEQAVKTYVTDKSHIFIKLEKRKFMESELQILRERTDPEKLILD